MCGKCTWQRVDPPSVDKAKEHTYLHALVRCKQKHQIKEDNATEARMSALEGKVSELGGRVGELDGKVNALDDKVSRIEDYLVRMESTLASLLSKLGGSEIPSST